MEVFSFWNVNLFTPKIRTVLQARLYVGKGGSVRWGPGLVLWCLESSASTLSGATGHLRLWKHRAAKILPICASYAALEGHYFYHIWILINKFCSHPPPSQRWCVQWTTNHKQVGAALLCTHHQQGEQWSSKADHGVGREFQAVENAQPALRAAHANTKYGVTTPWKAWETVLLYLHPCSQKYVTQCFLQMQSVQSSAKHTHWHTDRNS